MSKQLQIHNSTAEFLIFQAEDKAEGIQVFYQDENIWATQEVIATLFDKGRSTITEHLKNIFASGELQEEVVCRKFRQTTQHGAIEGKTQTRDVTFYNLDAIISVGYRVIQDRLFESDFDRFTLPTLPFDGETDNNDKAARANF